MRMGWETVSNTAESSRGMRTAVSPPSSHVDIIRGGDEGSFHAVVGSETKLSGVEKLVVIEVYSEASVDDFLQDLGWEW